MKQNNDKDGLFPNSISISTDDSPVVVSSKNWSFDTDIIASKAWVREANVIGLYSFDSQKIDKAFKALTEDSECVLRINGRGGYRDMNITRDKAKRIKLFYSAYQALKRSKWSDE